MWNPIEGIVDAIKELLFKIPEGGAKMALETMNNLFNLGVEAVKEQVGETPTGFSQVIVDNLRTISETAILPIAGLILTYVFCYEVYQMVTDKNKGGDFEIGQLIFLIIKTAVMITFITNSFTIALAVFDLSKWITDKIPDSTLTVPTGVTDNLISSMSADKLGEAFFIMMIAFIAVIIVAIMVGIIFLVAWSRIVTILLYISVAPIPFATFLNRDWIGSIGQSYVKNLIALMLQGYFMLVCLVIYSGLLTKVSDMIAKQDGANGIYMMILLITSMGILVVTLTKTHSLAKSVVGAM